MLKKKDRKEELNKQNKLWLSLGIIILIVTIVSMVIGAILSRTPFTNITVIVAIFKIIPLDQINISVYLGVW